MMRKWQFFVLLIGLFFSACSPPPTPIPPTPKVKATQFEIKTMPEETVTPTSWYAPEDILLGVVWQGGLCPYGMCGMEVIFYQDGSFDVTNSSGEGWEGIIEDAVLVNLRREIENADFDMIRSRPFTDMCPTAYDGAELIYTFYASEGVEVISSCEYVIDGDLELFVIIIDLMNDLPH